MTVLRNLPEGPGPWYAVLLPVASQSEIDALAEKAWAGDMDATSELAGRFIACLDKNRQYGRLPRKNLGGGA